MSPHNAVGLFPTVLARIKETTALSHANFLVKTTGKRIRRSSGSWSINRVSYDINVFFACRTLKVLSRQVVAVFQVNDVPYSIIESFWCKRCWFWWWATWALEIECPHSPRHPKEKSLVIVGSNGRSTFDVWSWQVRWVPPNVQLVRQLSWSQKKIFSDPLLIIFFQSIFPADRKSLSEIVLAACWSQRLFKEFQWLGSDRVWRKWFFIDRHL